MSVKPDHWIRKMALEHKMIEPFEDRQVRDGVISYGVSSYGYDIRVADEFRIFTNVNSTIVDPNISTRGRWWNSRAPDCLDSARTRSRWRVRWNISAFRATC